MCIRRAALGVLILAAGAARSATLTPSLAASSGVNSNANAAPEEDLPGLTREADGFVAVAPGLKAGATLAPWLKGSARYGLDMERYAKIVDGDVWTHGIAGELRAGGGGPAAVLSGGWQASALPNLRAADGRRFLDNWTGRGGLTGEWPLLPGGGAALQAGGALSRRTYPKYPVVHDATNVADTDPRVETTLALFAGGNWMPARNLRLTAAYQRAVNDGNALLRYHRDGALRDYFSYASNGAVVGAAFAPRKALRLDVGAQIAAREYSGRGVVRDPDVLARATILSGKVSVTWMLNRGAALVLDEQYVKYGANDPRSAYAANRLTLGLKLTEDFGF